jgi:DNA polymerase III gamma/tau subunit
MDTMLALKAVLVKEELWESPDIPDSFRTEGLSSIASSSKGSLREAFQLLERCITGEYWTADQIQEALGVLDEVATYNILQGLLIKSKEEKLWNSIYQADPGELYHYITLILADAMVAKHTGFIKDERFASSTKQIASSANAEQLFDALSDPLLAKPYIRKADLITVFMQYYKKEAPALVRKPIARRAI